MNSLKIIGKGLLAMLIIYIGSIILISTISSIYNYFNIDKYYKEMFNIEIKKPNKIQNIFNTGGIDPNDLSKLIYDKDVFLEALKYDYVLPIDENEVTEILEEKVYKYLDTENEEQLRSIIGDIIENEEIYYAHFLKKDSYEVIFLYDVAENIIYSLTMDL